MMRQYISKLENSLNIKSNSSEFRFQKNIPDELLFMKILNFIESDSLNFIWLGSIHYNEAWNFQKKIHQLILENKIKDTILFLEHFHVYTFGKNADQNHLLPSYNKQAEIIQSDRGGDITYHGPGQLVVYPIINLKNYNKSITWYINIIEQVIINSLKQYNIEANRKLVLKESINVLNDKEKHIILKRHLTYFPKTLEAVGKELHISKERVRQLESRAILKLKKRILTKNTKQDLI